MSCNLGFIRIVLGLCEIDGRSCGHKQRWSYLVCRVPSVRRSTVHSRRTLQNRVPVVRYERRWNSVIRYVLLCVLIIIHTI